MNAPAQEFKIFDQSKYSASRFREEILKDIGLLEDLKKADPLYELASHFAYQQLQMLTLIDDIAKRFTDELKKINEKNQNQRGSLEYYLDIAVGNHEKAAIS